MPSGMLPPAGTQTLKQTLRLDMTAPRWGWRSVTGAHGTGAPLGGGAEVTPAGGVLLAGHKGVGRGGKGQLPTGGGVLAGLRGEATGWAVHQRGSGARCCGDLPGAENSEHHCVPGARLPAHVCASVVSFNPHNNRLRWGLLVSWCIAEEPEGWQGRGTCLRSHRVHPWAVGALAEVLEHSV